MAVVVRSEDLGDGRARATSRIETAGGDQLREVSNRLVAAGLIVWRDGGYRLAPELEGLVKAAAGPAVTARDWAGAVLIALGGLWTVITVLAAVAALARPGGVDARALVGMLAVGGLALTWGWLLAGGRR